MLCLQLLQSRPAQLDVTAGNRAQAGEVLQAGDERVIADARRVAQYGSAELPGSAQELAGAGVSPLLGSASPCRGTQMCTSRPAGLRWAGWAGHERRPWPLSPA